MPDKNPVIAQVGNVDVGGIMCNDGNMNLEIVTSEAKGTWNSKHTEYRIKGNDSLGAIDVWRRYSEFHIFHMNLSQRYPGLFIPPIPPKKAQGQMDEFFIEERKHYLSQFLLKLTEHPILCRTPEVQVFIRP